MPKIDYRTTYHGTSDQFAKEIASGKIDVTAGGGELGQGFYLGTELHVAKAWAKQKFGGETVVEFVMSEDDFWSFDIEALNFLEATTIRLGIKSRGAQKSHIFNKDIVWSPIVGGPKVYCDQDKWESLRGGTASERIRNHQAHQMKEILYLSLFSPENGLLFPTELPDGYFRPVYLWLKKTQKVWPLTNIHSTRWMRGTESHSTLSGRMKQIPRLLCMRSAQKNSVYSSFHW